MKKDLAAISPGPDASGAIPDDDVPELLWLESAQDERTRASLSGEASRVAAAFSVDDLQPLERDLLRAMQERTRVSVPLQRSGWCYRYDPQQGCWLKSPVEADRRLGPWRRPKFSTDGLDLALSSNFVVCPYPSPTWRAGARAMVRFASGGTDAAESREVDLASEVVVAGGLHVPPSVHELCWDGPDAVLVSHRVQDGPDDVHWAVERVRRGEPQTSLRLHDFPPDRVVGSITRAPTAGAPRYLMSEWLDHRRRTYAVGHLAGDELTWMPVPVPPHVRLQLVGDVALLLPLAPWEVGGEVVPRGTVLTAPVTDLLEGATPYIAYRQREQERVMQVACSRNHALLVVSGDRATELLAVNVHTGALRSVVRAKAGTAAHAVAVDVTDEACADEFWVQTSGPVTPPTLTRVDLSRETRRWLVDESPPTFRHQDFVVRFAHTQAGPGGPVKYVVVAPANMPLDGENPTVLSGYGGFNFPERLDYLDLTGPTWLDRPGQDGRRSVFVFAYVGTTPAPEVPPWERLARSVDRFLAVAEQLCRDGVTRPSRLGALGESHGGLLVANAMVTRPRAFGAVACRSAVLDLLRYTELDGTAWTGEYGDPRDPSSRSALRGVSPCHRVAAGENYPPVLLSASSTDDRVSPAHSRKMTARLRAAGGTALYLESADGGHDGLGTTPAGARGLALTAAFFRRHLV